VLLQLLEDANTLLGPTERLWLHGRALLLQHGREAVPLLLDLVERLVGPLPDERFLLLAAARFGLEHIAE